VVAGSSAAVGVVVKSVRRVVCSGVVVRGRIGPVQLVGNQRGRPTQCGKVGRWKL